jgi:hypothetical protein
MCAQWALKATVAQTLYSGFSSHLEIEPIHLQKKIENKKIVKFQKTSPLSNFAD